MSSSRDRLPRPACAWATLSPLSTVGRPRRSTCSSFASACATRARTTRSWSITDATVVRPASRFIRAICCQGLSDRTLQFASLARAFLVAPAVLLGARLLEDTFHPCDCVLGLGGCFNREDMVVLGLEVAGLARAQTSQRSRHRRRLQV